MLEFGVEPGIAVDQARFDHVGHDGDVGLALGDAIAHAAHAVPDFEAEIPQQRQETRYALLEFAIGLLVEQDHQVDVRTGQDFGAAIAADRNQRRPARGARAEEMVEAEAQQAVDDTGADVHQLGGVGAGVEIAIDLRPRLLERRGQRCRPRRRVSARALERRVDDGERTHVRNRSRDAGSALRIRRR